MSTSALTKINQDCFGKQGAKLNDGLGAGDDFFRVLESASIFASQVSSNPSTIAQTTQYFSVTRSVISASRCIPLVGSFVSGSFWLDEKGKPEKWYNILVRVFVAVGRILSPFGWLHKINVINLGRHSTWFRLTLMSAFTAAGILSLINNLRKCYYSTSIETIKKEQAGQTLEEQQKILEKILKEDLAKQTKGKTDAFVDFLDLLTAPTENGAFSFTTKPLIIVDSILKIIASIGRLATM